MTTYETILTQMRARVAAGKRTASSVLMLGEDGEPAYCLTRRGLIVSATRLDDRIWYSHLSSRHEETLGFNQLRFSERMEIGRTLGREVFGDRLLPA